MKVAILSESAADEAAYRILVEAVLGVQTRPTALNPRSRGWPAVAEVLPAVVKRLHYRTDAEGLVVVADANHSPVHTPEHETATGAVEGCRLCRLRKLARDALDFCRPVHRRSDLCVAVGVAVPAVEAWLLCGAEPGITEAAWVNGLRQGKEPYTKQELKRRAGTERGPIAMLTDRMTTHARRLAEDVSQLERAFPNGFGPLAEALRAWQRP